MARPCDHEAVPTLPRGHGSCCSQLAIHWYVDRMAVCPRCCCDQRQFGAMHDGPLRCRRHADAVADIVCGDTNRFAQARLELSTLLRGRFKIGAFAAAMFQHFGAKPDVDRGKVYRRFRVVIRSSQGHVEFRYRKYGPCDHEAVPTLPRGHGSCCSQLAIHWYVDRMAVCPRCCCDQRQFGAMHDGPLRCRRHADAVADIVCGDTNRFAQARLELSTLLRGRFKIGAFAAAMFQHFGAKPDVDRGKVYRRFRVVIRSSQGHVEFRYRKYETIQSGMVRTSHPCALVGEADGTMGRASIMDACFLRAPTVRKARFVTANLQDG